MLTRSEQRDLLDFIKALADMNRLTTLALLSQGERNASDIAQALKISEPTASHHLARLRGVGLLNLRTQGNQRFYTLSTSQLARFKKLVTDIENLDTEDKPKEDFAWIDVLEVSDEDRKVLKDYTRGGRLAQIPSKEKKLLSVLRWLATRFQPGEMYTEKEVNMIIKEVNDDFATLRRDLVDFGFLRRERGGGKYWLTPEDEGTNGGATER